MSFWNDARVQELKTLAARGLSAGQIATELHAPSRNSVCGKGARLGIKFWAKPSNEERRATNNAEPKPVVERTASTGQNKTPPDLHAARKTEVAAEACASSGVVIPIGHRCTILSLTERSCRWPIGDPGNADFFFCGGLSIEGLPYCGCHARIAYQPRSMHRPIKVAARGLEA
jgi:GcrA cell cycle regulator